MAEPNIQLPERSDPRPWPDAIRAQLNRILVQAHFVGADDEVRLLRHLLELAANNQLDTISDANIAGQLFQSGRDETEAIEYLQSTYRDLREALISYFESRGRNDPVIFELPEDSISIVIKASDVQLELSEIDADSEQSAVLPQNKPVNIHAITAMSIMAIAGAIYFFGIDDLTTGPTGPESITDVGPLNQKLSSIAVKPFTNKGSDKVNSHYARTISIELATRLGREHSLRIIAPATMLALTPSTQSPSNIAKKVDVRYVLTGEISQTNNKHDLSVKLLHGDDQEIVWQKSYSHDPKSIAAVYGKISKDITAKLSPNAKAPKTGLKRERIEDMINVTPAGYKTYLQARLALISSMANPLAHSITLFRSAIKDNPSLPRAHSGLAASLTKLAGHGFERIPPNQSLTAAHKAAVHALRLNEYYPEPYAYLGAYRTAFERDWKSAERVYVYAIQFNPSYADARLYYSRFLESQGRHRDAIDQAERAHILNPLSPTTHSNRAWQYLQAEWFTRARKHFEKIRDTYPKHWSGSWGLGHYYWRRDDLSEAIELFQAASKLDPENTYILASLGHLYGLSKKPDKARSVLSAMTTINQSRYVSPLHIAMVHAGLNDTDMAFDWIEKAFRLRAYGLAWLAVTKEFEPLHHDDRYTTILKRLNLKPRIRKRNPQPS